MLDHTVIDISESDAYALIKRDADNQHTVVRLDRSGNQLIALGPKTPARRFSSPWNSSRSVEYVARWESEATARARYAGLTAPQVDHYAAILDAEEGS